MIGLETFVLPGALVVTSAAAYAVARRVLNLPPRRLRIGVAWMFECVGLMVAFLVLNVAAGAVFVHVFRLLTPRFVAIYAATDAVVVPLSLLQALILCGWRATQPAPSAPDAAR